MRDVVQVTCSPQCPAHANWTSHQATGLTWPWPALALGTLMLAMAGHPVLAEGRGCDSQHRPSLLSMGQALG